jgi:ribonuclease P protein component
LDAPPEEPGAGAAPAPGDKTLPKRLRIRKRSEFLALHETPDPERFHLGPFLLVIQGNGLGRNRMGLIVSKRSGIAVRRNNLKRRAREFFRERARIWPQGVDMLFIAKNAPGEAKKRVPKLDPVGPGLVRVINRAIRKAAEANNDPPVAAPSANVPES